MSKSSKRSINDVFALIEEYLLEMDAKVPLPIPTQFMELMISQNMAAYGIGLEQGIDLLDATAEKSIETIKELVELKNDLEETLRAVSSCREASVLRDYIKKRASLSSIMSDKKSGSDNNTFFKLNFNN